MARTEAVVGVFDRGLLEGFGLFETLAVRRGVVVRGAAHQERLRASMAQLGLPALPARLDLPEVTASLCEVNQQWDCAARWTVTAGSHKPTLLVFLKPFASDLLARRRGLWGKTVVLERPFASLKTTSWLAMTLVQEQLLPPAVGLDRPIEAIVCNRRRHILEGARSNLFIVRGDVLVTPPADGRILPGVTRAAVLQHWRASGREAIEAPLGYADLWQCDGAFLTSSLLGAAPLLGLNRRQLPTIFSPAQDAAINAIHP